MTEFGKLTREQLLDRLDELEPKYQSHEEARIGRLLDRYGIPFFCQQPVIVQDQGQNQWKQAWV